MTPEQWQKLNSVFLAALDLAPPARTDFVSQKLKEDNIVREEVLALLEAHSNSTTFLSRPALAGEQNDQLRPDPLTKGARLGPYIIQATLGSGGFAHVYLATEPMTNRQVALKVSRAIGKEAYNMAALKHSNIVGVYSQTDFKNENLRAIAMQYIAGTTLLAVMGKVKSGSAAEVFRQLDGKTAVANRDRSINFEPERARQREKWEKYSLISYYSNVLAQIANALAYAHELGILHLDIKPANILLDRYGTPYLTDFNISMQTSLLTPTAPETQVIGGTEKYMSPEQRCWFDSELVNKPPITAASDVYSWGILWDELTSLGANADSTVEIKRLGTACQSHEPKNRPAMSEIATQATAISDGLQTISAWPSNTPYLNALASYPVLAIVAMGIGPQIFGSMINIAYNALKIVPQLNPTQIESFSNALVNYNLFAYPVALSICLPGFIRLYQWCHTKPRETSADSFFRLTLLVAVVSTIGWLPGAGYFPFAVLSEDSENTIGLYFHFGLSFFLSWLAATTYSIVLIDWVITRALIPRYAKSPIMPSLSTQRQLLRRAGVMRFLSGTIPLVAALIIIFQSPLQTAGTFSNYTRFQLSVMVLLTLSLFGFLMVIRTTERVEDLLTMKS